MDSINARKVYGTFGANSKLVLSANWVHAINESIMNYTGEGFSSIASKNDGTFHDTAINNWYKSDVSKRLMRQLKEHLKEQKVTIPTESFNWSMKLVPLSMEIDEVVVNVGAPVSYLGDSDEGGVLGLVKNLVRMQSRIDGKSMSKSAGSGPKISREFTLEIQPIAPARYDLYHGEDEIVHTKNYGTFTVADPVSDYVYCTSKVLDHLFTHCYSSMKNVKKQDDIEDVMMTDIEFVDHVKKLQQERILVRNIKIIEVIPGINKFYKTRELLKTFSKLGGSTKQKRQYVHVIVQPHKNHISIGNRHEFGQYETKECDLCNRRFVLGQFDGHITACRIRASRTLANLAVGRKQYLAKHIEYNLDDLDRDYNSKYALVVEEFVRQKGRVFVTGPGGNGKSFMIKSLLREFPDKNFWVMAPTGVVAGDYEGGHTWQKEFRLPLIAKNDKIMIELMKNPKELESILFKVWNFEKPDGIIVDEVCMIRGRDIIFMEMCLQLYFKNDLAWGGIPFLCAGDPAQLPPVDKESKSFDLAVSAHPIAHIRQFGCLIELNAPRRLMRGCRHEDGRVDMVKVNIQAAHLADIRVGHVTPDFIEYIRPRHLIDTGPGCHFDDILSGAFDEGDDIVITFKNASVANLVKRKYANRELSLVGKDNHGHKLEVFNGMRLLVCDNEAINDELVFNGTSCTVVDWEVNKWIDLEFPHGVRRISIGAGRNTLKNRFALGYYYIRSIHKCQGATINGRVFYYGDGPGIPKSFISNPGLLYVAFSRCTNLENLYIVTSSKYTLEQHVNAKTCRQLQTNVQVVDDPKVHIAHDILESDDGSVVCRDTSNWNGCKTYKNAAIKDKNGLHKDCFMMENERIYNNTLNIDHETWNEELNGEQKLLSVNYSAPLWYFNGQITDFRNFIERNGGSLDGLIEYTRLPTGHMEFSFLNCDAPAYELCKYICRILKMGDVDKEVFNNSDEVNEIFYLHSNPMISLGFNNLGFDERFNMKEMITHLCGFKFSIINAGGSNLKDLSFHYSDGKCAYRVYDLMEVTGQGGLKPKIDSYVKPFLSDKKKFMSMHSKMWTYGTSPFGGCILKDLDATIECTNEEWGDMDERVKEYAIEEWFLKYYSDCGFPGLEKHVMKAEKLQHIVKKFVSRCKNGYHRDVVALKDCAPGFIKKGCVPLKYIGSLSAMEYRGSETIDLIDIMTVDGIIDWSIAFFQREISEAKEMVETLGEGYFREYYVWKEMREYAVNDVLLNDYLARVLDGNLYEYGNTLDAINIKNSWAGLRLSIYNFSTTASLAGHMAWSNLPKEVYFKDSDDPQVFKTKLSLPPISMDHMILGICGGKTQARCAHFVSTNPDTDYCVYPDVSGMYMKIQEENEYPFGDMKFYQSGVSDDVLDSFLKRYNGDLPVGDLYTRCRIFHFKAHHDPREIENVLGRMGNSGRLIYDNTSNTFSCIHAELEMFKLFGGTVEEFITITEWEDQCKMFEGIMKFYSVEKEKATQDKNDVLKAVVKLGANATFGMTARSDKNDKVVYFTTPEEKLILHSKYPNGIRNETPFNGGIVGKVTETHHTVTQNPSYLGRFTLGYSKKMLYHAIYIGLGGEDRFNIDNLGRTLFYGDTDSTVCHREFIDRLVAYDKTVDVKDKKLYCKEYGTNNKAGKFTDELADDVKKYVGKEYADEMEKEFRNFPSWNGFQPRIKHCFNPASKCGGNHVIFPPMYWDIDGRPTTWEDYPQPSEQEWLHGYKCFAKGVSKGSTLRLKIREHHTVDGFEKDDDGFIELRGGLSYTKKCFDLLEYSHRFGEKINTKRAESILKKYLFVCGKDVAKGVGFGDILSIPDPGKNILGSVNTGRKLVLKSEFRGEHTSVWLNRGYSIYDISEGYCVPRGYKNGDLDFTEE